MVTREGHRQRIESRQDLWPIVLFTMHDGLTDEDFEDMFAVFSQCYARRQRFCPITDASQLSTVPSASSRHLVARLAREHEPMSRVWILESNVVMRSGLVRGALTAITWLAPPVYPLFYVASLSQACARALAALEGASIEVPSKAKEWAAGSASRGIRRS